MGQPLHLVPPRPLARERQHVVVAHLVVHVVRKKQGQSGSAGCFYSKGLALWQGSKHWYRATFPHLRCSLLGNSTVMVGCGVLVEGLTFSQGSPPVSAINTERRIKTPVETCTNSEYARVGNCCIHQQTVRSISKPIRLADPLLFS